jgi:hypothetical protein
MHVYDKVYFTVYKAIDVEHNTFEITDIIHIYKICF